MRHHYLILTMALIMSVNHLAFSQDNLLSASIFPLETPAQGKLLSLKDVLTNLEEQYQIRFNYASQLIEKKDIFIDVSQLSGDLDASLKEILSPLNLRYERINDKIIGIYPQGVNREDNPKKSKKENESEATFYHALVEKLDRRALANSQKLMINIIGKVTDENSEPLPGVNVLVKNTTVGTVTDIEGNYRLNAPDNAETLVFSSVGYETKEVNINGQTTINLSMSPDIQALSEVVVVGYGTQKKSDLTGAVSSVEPQEITRVSERRLEAALQGRAAGVQVTRSEGNPGGEASVFIRGAGSIGNSSPLWVVDGVPMDPGNYFNMNDVESIEILKDASAAAIYGARAAHGVILVTTKRGSEGKVNVNFNSTIGQRRAVNLPNLLGTPDFVEVSTRSREAAGIAPEPQWANPNALPNTNWVDEVFAGSGLEQTYNLSLSGGNENASFFISSAYDREEGILIDNWFERFAVRANSDYKIGKRIKIGESLLVSRTRENPVSNDGLEQYLIYRAPPEMPLFDESNPLGGWGRGPSYFNGPNPVSEEYQRHLMNNNTRINGNLYAEIEILDGLKLRGSFGANLLAGRSEAFIEAFDHGTRANPQNNLTHSFNDVEEYNSNVTLNYDKTFGKHQVQVLGGYERFMIDGLNLSATAFEFPVTSTRTFALATGAVDINERRTISQLYRLESLFGRVNYSFNNKYLLSVNVRRDGSSRFGPENQYGVFPSVSAGWRIMEESFMPQNTFLSDLKLRASYGILGSDRINDFIFSRTYTNRGSTYTFDREGTKVRGFYLSRFPNELVKWEEVVQTDIGLDASFFEGKLNMTADYYVKTTQDMLIGVRLPRTAGFGGRPEFNIGSVENRGFELMLNYQDRIGDLTLDISGNAAWNQNEVNALSADDQLFSGNGGPLGGNISLTEAGLPIGSFFGWTVDGVYQTQAEVDADNNAAPEGVYQNAQTAPGDFRYVDIDGDNRITADDRSVIGNPWPGMIYGLNATFGYKGFDFTLFFQGVQDVDIVNVNKVYYRSLVQDYNTSDLALEGWTEANPTQHPRLNFNDPNGNFRRPSSYFVEDGSYLRLRTIQLGYSLPKSLLDNIGLTSARVFVNGQNILTITGYEGLDPEVGGGGNINRGFDGLNQYPQTRLLSAGVQIGF